MTAFALVIGCGRASATTITIDDSTDTFANVGDYYVVKGGSGQSSPGQVFDVLTLQADPSESGTNTVATGDIYDFLKGINVTSANKLLFGLGINEPNSTTPEQFIDVNALTMSFALPGGGTKSFNLGDNILHIKDWVNGASSGDALIGIDLGFDFLSKYNTDSTELFTISSSIFNTSGGFEIYFVDSALYDLPTDPGGGGDGGLSPVPEPASLTLFGTGLAYVASRVRRRKNAKQ